jgi:hypothetical protein
LLVAFYGCKTWSLKLREEQRLGVFENRVLRGMFVPKRGEETEAGVMRDSVIRISHKMLLGSPDQGGRDGWGM